MDRTNRITLTRCLTAYVLLFYLLRFFLHLTPSGLQGPPLFVVGLDVTYWLNRVMRIPAIMMYSHTGAWIFDILVFLTGLMVLLFPLSRKALISFSLLLILYAVNFNTVASVHTVTVAGLIIVFLPFWFRKDDLFALAWEGMRYYTCVLYFTAFIWKAVYGNAFFSWPTGSEVFRSNLVNYLYYNSGTTLAGILRWFIRHAWLVNAGAIFVYLLEGVMIVGLFTKRYDRWLGWLPVLISVINYFFVDVFIFEVLVLNFSFISWRTWDRIAARWPPVARNFGYV